MALAAIGSALPTILNIGKTIGGWIGKGIRKIRDRRKERQAQRRNKMRSEPAGISNFGRKLKAKFGSWRNRWREGKDRRNEYRQKYKDARQRVGEVVDQVGQLGNQLSGAGGGVGGKVGGVIQKVGGTLSAGARIGRGGMERVDGHLDKLRGNLETIQSRLENARNRYRPAGLPPRVTIVGVDGNLRIRPVPIGREQPASNGGGPAPYPADPDSSLPPIAGLGVDSRDWSRYSAVVNPTWGESKSFANRVTADAVTYFRPKTQLVGSVISADARMQGPSLMEMRPFSLEATQVPGYAAALPHQGPELAPPFVVQTLERGRMDLDTGPDW